MDHYTSSTNGVSTSDANLLLGLNSPYGASPNMQPYQQPSMHTVPNGNAYGHSAAWGQGDFSQGDMQNFGDMMIESQDVDMSMLGLDMMPWFDSYPTHDMLNMFDPGGHGDTTGGVQQHQHSNGALQ